MEATTRSITMSFVVPVYSGAAYLPELVRSMAALRQRWDAAGVAIQITEAIFVLDAPVDDSASVLANLANENPWVRIVELSRNFGQHSATVAGILYSSGEWVVTLDEDLQHKPAQVENLLFTACDEHADVVYALPQQWVHGGGYRDRMSRAAKFLIGTLSGNPYVPMFNSFRLLRGDIARAASSICAQQTYFDVALTWFTQRFARVPLPLSDDRYVAERQSGYRLWTLIQHGKRLLLTSQFHAMRLTSTLSLVALMASAGYAGWILWVRFFSDRPIPVEGWASLMVVLLAFGSVALFFLGVIIEVLHVSMLQLQGKPAFFVVDRAADALLAAEVEKLRQR